MHKARTKNGGPLSRSTQDAYFQQVGAALNQAEQERLLPDNPGTTCPKLSGGKEQTGLPDRDDFDSGPNRVPYDVLKARFLFLCCTGLRWSDIHKLTWEARAGALLRPLPYRLPRKTSGLQYLDLNVAMRLMGRQAEHDKSGSSGPQGTRLGTAWSSPGGRCWRV